MFCFQCEQAAGGKGCTGTAGVCGKKAGTAELQDKLIGALIGLARAAEGNEDMVSSSTDKAVLEGLMSAVADADIDDETITALIAQAQEEKRRLVPNCFFCASPCGRTNDYDMQELWTADEDIRSLKSLILFGIGGIAPYACNALVLGRSDKDVNEFFYKALFAIGMNYGINELLPIVSEVSEVNLKCMALPDKADNEASILPAADKIAKAVREGTIKHIFLIDLCDTAIPDSCCTEFVKQTPDHSIVLTLACEKYRFTGLSLGNVGGLPRIMEIGPCNDAYSTVKVVMTLAEAFKCSVSDLPLSAVLFWHGQNAVCNLLTLLNLGIKNILLGPSLPAFISQNVLDLLGENHNIAAITTPEEDLRRILG